MNSSDSNIARITEVDNRNKQIRLIVNENTDTFNSRNCRISVYSVEMGSEPVGIWDISQNQAPITYSVDGHFGNIYYFDYGFGFVLEVENTTHRELSTSLRWEVPQGETNTESKQFKAYEGDVINFKLSATAYRANLSFEEVTLMDSDVALMKNGVVMSRDKTTFIAHGEKTAN